MTYAKAKDFTMVIEECFDRNLEIARMARPVPGVVVECGVWRGGMIAAIAAELGPSRIYHLFDSFEGLPPAEPIDGEAARQYQQNTQAAGYFDNCSADESFAYEAMQAIANGCHFEVHRGWFEATLPPWRNIPNRPIALLRLDADWYASTMTCLQHLYDAVAVGGIVIVDDYYVWDGCALAVHDFLAQRRAPERIRSAGEVCYFVKEIR